jgi:hypothetical protein
MKGVTATAGKWDRKAWPAYFVASTADTLEHAFEVHEHLLLAVNELAGDAERASLRTFLGAGNKVLIDSGIFWLSTQHAKAHGLSMNEALALAPDKVDGFDELLARYVEIIREVGDRVWGYIEVDQGGRANKIKTRARLEKMGLRPIPVYHPFNDGWDYFDYLAERYDRICFGNVVQADPETRKRLIATAWERRRKYPNLWIHALGMTASELLAAWPLNSCDSSTWLSAVRWGPHQAVVAAKRCWPIGLGFNYRLEGDVKESHKAVRMCGYTAAFACRSMRTMATEHERVLGCDVGAFR